MLPRPWRTGLVDDPRPEPVTVEDAGEGDHLLLTEGRRGSLEASPRPLNLRKDRSTASPSFAGVLGPETALLLTLPEDGPEVVGDALPEPVDARLGVLGGTAHRKDHVFHPCVPLGKNQVIDAVDVFGLPQNIGRLAEGERLGSNILQPPLGGQEGRVSLDAGRAFANDPTLRR